MAGNRFRASLCALIGTATVGAITPAFAADAALEEVVVSAQKRAENIQDVPIAIDAFTEDMVKQRGIDGAADLAVLTPSLKYGEAVGSAQLSIRGVGFALFTGAGENSVAVHRDGIYIANPGAVAILQSGASSIEVLKGPQGTLWGRNATAGVINFVSAAPRNQLGGSIAVGYGNYDARTLDVDVDVPIGESVRSLFSFASDDRDGYLDNDTLDKDQLGYDKQMATAAFDIDLGDSLSAEVRMFHAESDIDGPAYDPAPSPALRAFDNPAQLVRPGAYDTDPYKSLANADALQEDTLNGGSIRFDYDISDSLYLTSITGYVDFDRKVTDMDHDGTAAEMFTLDRETSDQTFSQEFNLNSQQDALSWLLGLYYLEQDVRQDTAPADLQGTALLAPYAADALGGGVAIPGFPTSTYYVLDQLSLFFKEEVSTVAVFADSTYSLNDALRVFGGIRWMREERDATLTQTLNGNLWSATGATDGSPLFAVVMPGGPAPGACTRLQSSTTDTATTGRLGTQWDLNASVMLYAQLSSGYKSGGNSTSACGDDFEPEKLNALEVGFKSEFLDGRGRFNGALFAYDYTDLQVEEVVGASARVNNADAEIQGAELDVLFNVTQNFSVNSSVTLLDAQYTKFENVDLINDSTFANQNLDGNEMIRSPSWAAVLGGEYSRAIADLGTLLLRMDVSVSDSYQLREFDNRNDEQDSYTEINASMQFASPDEIWKFTVWGKNLTDEEHLYSLINGNSLSGPGLPGWANGVYSTPRTYGAKIEYAFY